MPARGRLPSFIRILRLFAALSLLLALAGVVIIAGGKPAGNVRVLIAASVGLGAVVLTGMAVLLYAYRQKEKNDPRS